MPSLCLIVDRPSCGNRILVDLVSEAVAGGVDMVQLRNKHLPSKHLLDVAHQLRAATLETALFFVNDRLDIALACGADGVQLGEDSLPLETAREITQNRLLLSRSVHSVEGAIEAEANGASFLIVGTIFPTTSHPESTPSGVELLERMRKRVHIPYLAIGGVRPENVKSIIMAGASGAAVITAITLSNHPQQASQALKDQMIDAWASTRDTNTERET